MALGESVEPTAHLREFVDRVESFGHSIAGVRRPDSWGKAFDCTRRAFDCSPVPSLQVASDTEQPCSKRAVEQGHLAPSPPRLEEDLRRDVFCNSGVADASP